MLGSAQQEGKREGGHTWWVLVAGEGLNEGLGTSRTAAAAAAAAAVALALAQMERTRGRRGVCWMRIPSDFPWASDAVTFSFLPTIHPPIKI